MQHGQKEQERADRGLPREYSAADGRDYRRMLSRVAPHRHSHQRDVNALRERGRGATLHRLSVRRRL